MARMTALRCRMIDDMKIRNLSPVTQRCYVHAVAKFARHFNRSPDLLGAGRSTGLSDPPHLHRHLVGRLQCRSFGPALLLWRHPRTRRDGRAHPLRAQAQQLPVILSADEIVRFFAAVPSLKHRTALMTAYAAGLRVSEVVRLRVADIDSGRMLIRVEQGKGHRDRYVMLSAQLLIMLRTYWQEIRPKHWLFPGPRREPAARREHAPLGVPECSQGGEARKAGERPYACATALPPTCSKPAPISARSRCCSAISICRRRRVIPRSRRPRSAIRSARSTG